MEPILVHKEFEEGRATGLGLRTGKISGGILAVDLDGQSAIDKFTELYGGTLPQTVSFTSGKPGRMQLIFKIPQEQWAGLKNKFVFQTGEGEQIELRWNNHLSVLPPSIHPETQQSYQWINSPDSTATATCPEWILDPLREPPRSTLPSRSKHPIPSDAIPLKKLLAPQHRELIAQGIAEGSRNNAGAALARDLIGVERWANQRGIQIEGTAYDLLFQFGSQCKLPLEEAELKTIYESALRSDPRPCLDEEKLLGCIDAYRNKQTVHHSKGFGRPAQKANPIQVDDSVWEEVKQLNSLKKINHSGILPPKLRNLLREVAEKFNCPLEALELGVLTVAASQLPSPTRLSINGVWSVPPILFTVFVAESGAKKTPVMKVAVDPLKKLQSQSDEKFKVIEEEYKDKLSQWKAMPRRQRGPEPEPPVARELYLTDATTESIVAYLDKYPDRGILLFSDELIGFLGRQNQYRNGAGGDRQFWLELYDGSPVKAIEKPVVAIPYPQHNYQSLEEYSLGY